MSPAHERSVESLGPPLVSVVIPAYNEEHRLAPSLERIAAYMKDAGIDWEVVVIDDGSVDATGRIATEFLRGRRGKLLRNDENRGKGYAVRRGVLEASGRWALLTDADLSAPIEEHAKLHTAVVNHDLDMAIGSRGLPDSRIEVPQRRLRQEMGKTFNRLMRILTGLPYSDTQCGFKLLDRVRCRPLFERMVVNRFAFDVELLFLCVRFGLRVREIPVVWRNAPGSKVGLVADPLNMLFDVARVRWRFRRGLYNPETAPALTDRGEGEGGA